MFWLEVAPPGLSPSGSVIVWKETRGLPAHKVVLGVPFYARPSWADYGTILAAVPDAFSKDRVVYNGMEVYYNGVMLVAQAKYAVEFFLDIKIPDEKIAPIRDEIAALMQQKENR